jgi:Mg-chelatase subunit ChlD
MNADSFALDSRMVATTSLSRLFVHDKNEMRDRAALIAAPSGALRCAPLDPTSLWM